MIDKKVYTKTYIDDLVKKYKADPQIIERAVFALGLLEALVVVGTTFIFKGGSALMLLLEKPFRLSTDVDIIVKPEFDIEKYVNKASEIYPFIRYEEDTRVGANSIVKKHYRFYYKSLANELKEIPILLDILFEENHYATIVKKEIKTEFLEVTGNPVFVNIPNPNSILGDKLTAFAPHTIGVIPINTRDDGKIVDKRIECIKQFFDVACLIDVSNNFEEVLKTYKQTSSSEIAYRGLSISYKDCLLDCFNSALSIASRGKWSFEDYSNYLFGIRGLAGYLINIRFNAETAYRQASKVMYLTACLVKEIDPEKDIPDASPFTNEYSIINNIRKIDKDAFNRIARAITLINQEFITS